MAKIEITRPELVWPGKYDKDGELNAVPHVNLPFQVIETVNESQATRELKKPGTQHVLFDFWNPQEGNSFDSGWKNKLIWGDNLLVEGSLLEKFAGKIDLIYIDPPFATGADFTYNVEIGETGEEFTKDRSIIEEKAYRDTWAKGTESFIQMIYDRLVLMRELLSDKGSIYVHCDWRVNSFIRLILDEVFGANNLINFVSWKRYAAHNLSEKRYDAITDSLLVYSKMWPENVFNPQFGKSDESELGIRFPHLEEQTGRRFQHVALEQSSNSSSRGELRIIDGREVTTTLGWRWSQKTFDENIKENPRIIYWTSSGRPRYKLYADEYAGSPLGDIWIDIGYLASNDSEAVGYPTQKPEALLERVIKASSNEGDLVADFFCGSGTTLAVAEKLGRRWIGCDLGRWAIHTTRKRLLGIENCKPFEVLNLGKYERQYWQGISFGNEHQQKLYEYLAFILKLYNAQPISGCLHLHGKNGPAMVHVAAVDSPVTITEINEALDECIQLKQKELHILGWEWEMGLNSTMKDEAKKRGITLKLKQIPREVMEVQVTDQSIRFFELSYLDVAISKAGQKVTVELTDFASSNKEILPDEVLQKIQGWADYIDFWAIDWDFQNDTFMQGWVDYRTKRKRSLSLISDPHRYDKPGTYKLFVKVIDIFGNDTSRMFSVEVM